MSASAEELSGVSPANLHTTGITLIELQQLGRGANGELFASWEQVFNPMGIIGKGGDNPAGRYGALTTEIEHEVPAGLAAGEQEPIISYRTTDGRTSLLSLGRQSDSFVLVHRESDERQDDGAPGRFTLMYVRRARDANGLAQHTFSRYDVSTDEDLVGLLDIESALELRSPDTANPVAQRLGPRTRINDIREAALDDDTLSQSSIAMAYPDAARDVIEAGVAISKEARLMIDGIGAPERDEQSGISAFTRGMVARLAVLLAADGTQPGQR